MKRLFNSRKRIAAVSAAVGLGLVGGGVIAYFTTTGNGTGTATTGSSTAWTVGETGTATGGPLYPDAAIGGANIQTDPYTVTNGSAGSQNLTQVTIQVATSPGGGVWTVPGDTTKPACNASDYSVGGSAVGATRTDTALAGDFISHQSKTGSVTVELIDNGFNQDNCQGVTVPLYFVAS
jgi:hypothetical protein